MKESIATFFLCEIGVVHLSNCMTPGIKGPAFLVYYFVLWCVLLGISKWNGWHVILPVIIYISAGVTRFIAGQEHGMSRFGFLWLMMFVGVIVYLFQPADIFLDDGSRRYGKGARGRRSSRSRRGGRGGHGGGYDDGGGCGSGGGGCGGCGED